jgi:hypothetical protein
MRLRPMSEYIIPIITFFSGLGTGLISGLVVQRKKFNDDQKTAKISRLFPFLEHAYPIVERLRNHSNYAHEVLHDDFDFKNAIGSVTDSLDEYFLWFDSFKEEGMIRELDSINSELLDHLVGLANYASQKNRHGNTYISQNIDDFSKLCASSEKLLGDWLMS